MVNIIKAIREDLGLTQQQLTKKIGVSRQTIYYIEKNAYNPSLEIIRKLLKALDKKFEEVFFEVPVIKDLIENVSLKDLKEMGSKIGISYDEIASLSEVTDEELTQNYAKEILERISDELKVEFDDLFEIE